MPFFFLIAGYAHGMKDHFSGGQRYSGYIRKYFVELYLPALYLSLMYWGPKYFLLSPSSNIANVKLTSLTALYLIPIFGFEEYWFITVLFFMKVIHISAEYVFRTKKALLIFWLAVIAGVYAFLAVKYYGGVGYSKIEQLYRGLFFPIGYAIRQWNIITEDKHPKALYGLIVFVGGSLSFLLPGLNGTTTFFSEAASAIFISVGLMIMFYAFGTDNGFLVFCGVYSMVFYVVHVYVIAAVRMLYKLLGLASVVNPSILFAVCFAVSLLVPFLLVKLYQNVKCFRWVEYIFYPGRLLLKH